jgi:L-iditol 2-dehydrogenase
MRAITLHAVDDLRYETVPEPELREGTVRVRIAYCGICGSDIPRCFSKGTYRFPTICGHEMAGVIESCSETVKDFAPGDRVAVFPLIWRDDHPASEEGHYAQSEGYDYLGSRSDGAFSEYVVAPARNLMRVPDGVSMEEAAMTEPAAVALHSLRRATVTAGETLAIFGLGPIGLMVAQWARVMGTAAPILFDIDSAKLELARSLGFERVYNSNSSDPTETIDEHTGGRGVHVAVEAAGVPPTLLSACQHTRRGGRTVMLGNPSGDVTFPASLLSQMMRRETTLIGTWNSEYRVFSDDDDWRTTLNAMNDGSLDLKPLITHRLDLGDGIDALRMMRDQREFFCKVLLDPTSNDGQR